MDEEIQVLRRRNNRTSPTMPSAEYSSAPPRYEESLTDHLQTIQHLRASYLGRAEPANARENLAAGGSGSRTQIGADSEKQSVFKDDSNRDALDNKSEGTKEKQSPALQLKRGLEKIAFTIINILD